MRLVAAVAIAATLFAASPGEAGQSLRDCGRKPPQSGPPGLPATLSLATRCGDFYLHPDGSVHPNGRGIPSDRMPRPSIAFGDGVSWHLVRGRLTAHRGAVRVWRSSRRYPRLFDLQGAAVGANAVAFIYRSRLFVAAGGPSAAERPVARNERPLGWSRDGLLFTSRGFGEGGDVRLRGADGTFVAVVQRRPRHFRFDAATHTVLTITRGARVARFDGRSTTSLVRLRDLRMPVWTWPEPLAGGLVGLTAQRRVAILRSDGSLFASATFPRGRRWNGAGNSGLVADPEGHAVALTLTEGNTGYATAPSGCSSCARGIASPVFFTASHSRSPFANAGLRWRGTTVGCSTPALRAVYWLSTRTGAGLST
jgi:hypothetical protein